MQRNRKTNQRGRAHYENQNLDDNSENETHGDDLFRPETKETQKIVKRGPMKKGTVTRSRKRPTSVHEK